MGEVADMKDEGGTMVIDVGNMKISTFLRFEIFGFFFVGGTF